MGLPIFKALEGGFDTLIYSLGREILPALGEQ
jgi:hypothetical protein